MNIVTNHHHQEHHDRYSESWSFIITIVMLRSHHPEDHLRYFHHQHLRQHHHRLDMFFISKGVRIRPELSGDVGMSGVLTGDVGRAQRHVASSWGLRLPGDVRERVETSRGTWSRAETRGDVWKRCHQRWFAFLSCFLLLKSGDVWRRFVLSGDVWSRPGASE